jgi:hypothetical protein
LKSTRTRRAAGFEHYLAGVQVYRLQVGKPALALGIGQRAEQPVAVGLGAVNGGVNQGAPADCMVHP